MFDVEKGKMIFVSISAGLSSVEYKTMTGPKEPINAAETVNKLIEHMKIKHLIENNFPKPSLQPQFLWFELRMCVASCRLDKIGFPAVTVVH